MTPSQEDLLPDDPTQEAGPDIGQILMFGIGRFRYWVGLFAILGGLGGLAAALMQPNQFTSEVQLLMRPGVQMQRSPESILNPDQIRPTGGGSVILDEIQILRNIELPARVVEKVGAQLVLEPYDPRSRDTAETSWLIRKLHDLQASWASRPRSEVADGSLLAQQAAAARISANLRLNSARGSGVIAIRYTAHSPETARTVLAAFLEVALERHGEVFGSAAGLKMVTERLEEALDKETNAKKAFGDHRDQCGILDFDVQREEALRAEQRILDRIEQDRGQLEVIKSELKLQDERLDSISSELERDPTSTARLQHTPEFAQLQQAIRNLQTERSQLSVRFVEGSDSYRSEEESLKLQIAGNQHLLESTEEWLPFETLPGGGTNPYYTEVVAAKLDLERRQTGLIAGHEFHQDMLKRSKVHLKDVMSCDLIHSNHRVAIARAQQDVLTLERIHTRESALAELDKSASLIVIQSATLPTGKDGPERLQTLLLGLALGLFAGLAFAVLRQFADSKMRYPAEVETALGIPVLGLIPECRRWRRLTRKLARQPNETSPEPA